MPRPMFQQKKTSTTNGDLLSTTATNRQFKTDLSPMEIDKMLRKSRSKEYMEAIRKLDSGGRVMSQKEKEKLLDIVKNEFPELDYQAMMLGVVSKCYIGKPYEVHTLDIIGDIIEHYQIGQKLPDGLEKARSLAIHGGYDFIEVYTDCMRCISANGTVSVVR